MGRAIAVKIPAHTGVRTWRIEKDYAVTDTSILLDGGVLIARASTSTKSMEGYDGYLNDYTGLKWPVATPYLSPLEPPRAFSFITSCRDSRRGFPCALVGGGLLAVFYNYPKDISPGGGSSQKA